MSSLFKENPKNIIISVKPEYAIKIVEGNKTIELRRKFPTENIKGGIAIIYASSPVKQIIGYVVIEEVHKLPTSQIWKIFGKKACVGKSFFNSYFQGIEEGFAIALSNPVKLDFPMNMKKLEEDYSISVPQSYRYVTSRLVEAVGS